MRVKSNRLKPEAIPSIIDFSGYSTGPTDRPTASTNTSDAICRRDRALKRSHQAEDREGCLAVIQHASKSTRQRAGCNVVVTYTKHVHIHLHTQIIAFNKTETDTLGRSLKKWVTKPS